MADSKAVAQKVGNESGFVPEEQESEPRIRGTCLQPTRSQLEGAPAG